MLIENLLLRTSLLALASDQLVREARHTPGFTPSGFSVTGGAPHEIGHYELGDRLAMLRNRENQLNAECGLVLRMAEAMHIMADTIALARDISACFDANGNPLNPVVQGDGIAEMVRRWRSADETTSKN